MENPELEFLQYLLNRFISMRDVPVDATVAQLLDSLDEELTPIGGG